MLVKYNPNLQFDPDSFDCGHLGINKFLDKGIKEQYKKGFNHSYLYIENGNVIGYYTLQAFALTKERVFEHYNRKSIPTYIPIFRICLLGVDNNSKGKGMGKYLLSNAIKRTMKLKKFVGAVGLYVDSSPDGLRLYTGSGFAMLTPPQSSSETPMILEF